MSEATDRVISGLEGVLACESSIAYIDGTVPELSFRGYDIHDIAQQLTFEQVAFLLWHDRLPNHDELLAFSAELSRATRHSRGDRDLAAQPARGGASHGRLAHGRVHAGGAGCTG